MNHDVKHLGALDGQILRNIARGGVLRVPIRAILTSWAIRNADFTSGSYPPDDPRTGLVQFAADDLGGSELDYFGQANTGSNVVPYMEQTTDTPNAEAKGEGDAAGEATYVFEERTEMVRSVRTSIPFTMEVARDEPLTQTMLGDLLRGAVTNELIKQVISGNGTAPNLPGMLASSRAITRAIDVNENITAARIAAAIDASINAIEQGDRESRVNAIFLRSLASSGHDQYQTLSEYSTGLEDGRLRYSDDGLLYYRGKPVIRSGHFPSADDTQFGLCGDFRRKAYIVLNQDATIEVSQSHDTDFTRWKLRMRAELAAALVVLAKGSFRVLGTA